jgi:hypothetical protein
VGVLSIAGAVVEVDSPFEGLIVVSPESTQKALATIPGPSIGRAQLEEALC